MRIAKGTEAVEGRAPRHDPTARLPELNPRFMAAHGIAPIADDGSRLIVAMHDPSDEAAVAALAFATGRTVLPRSTPAPSPDEPPSSLPAAPSLFDQVAGRFRPRNRYRALRRLEALSISASDGRDLRTALAEIVSAGHGRPATTAFRQDGVRGEGAGSLLRLGGALPDWAVTILDRSPAPVHQASCEVAEPLRQSVLWSQALSRGAAAPLVLVALGALSAHGTGSRLLVVLAALLIGAGRLRHVAQLFDAAERLGIVTAALASGVPTRAAVALVAAEGSDAPTLSGWLTAERGALPAEARSVEAAERVGDPVSALRIVSARRYEQATLALAEDGRWWTMASAGSVAFLLIARTV